MEERRRKRKDGREETEEKRRKRRDGRKNIRMTNKKEAERESSSLPRFTCCRAALRTAKSRATKETRC